LFNNQELQKYEKNHSNDVQIVKGSSRMQLQLYAPLHKPVIQ